MDQPFPIQLFLRLSEEEQLAELFLLAHKPDVLRRLRAECGVRECPVDCIPDRLPCPKHSAWGLWRDQGLTPRQIRQRWEEETGERVKIKQVKRACQRPDPANCGCQGAYRPCPHLRPEDLRCQLSLKVQALLDALLMPSEYSEPDLGEPILVNSRVRKAVMMAERAAAGKHPRHPSDLPQLIGAEFSRRINGLFRGH